MNARHFNRAIAGIAAGGLLVLGAAAGARATVLTFDIRYINNTTYWGAVQSMETQLYDYGDGVFDSGNDDGDGDPNTTFDMLNVNYPDRVTGPNNYDIWYNYTRGNDWTPNVDVDYDTPGGDLKTHDGGGWSNRVVTGYDTGDMVLTFNPDPGYQVAVNSFVLDSYDSTTTTLEWTLRQGSPSGTIVASSGGSMTTNDPSGQTINTGAGFYSGPLVLVIDVAGPIGYLGLDDVNFDQQLVPEPAAFGVLGAASLLALSRRRRT